MGAQTPDAYRYGGGQIAREYPRAGAGSSPSTPTESSMKYRRTDEDRGLTTMQSSPFAPPEHQVLPEREYMGLAGLVAIWPSEATGCTCRDESRRHCTR